MRPKGTYRQVLGNKPENQLHLSFKTKVTASQKPRQQTFTETAPKSIHTYGKSLQTCAEQAREKETSKRFKHDCLHQNLYKSNVGFLVLVNLNCSLFSLLAALLGHRDMLVTRSSSMCCEAARDPHRLNVGQKCQHLARRITVAEILCKYSQRAKCH